jgi:hypothetical protein
MPLHTKHCPWAQCCRSLASNLPCNSGATHENSLALGGSTRNEQLVSLSIKAAVEGCPGGGRIVNFGWKLRSNATDTGWPCLPKTSADTDVCMDAIIRECSPAILATCAAIT